LKSRRVVPARLLQEGYAFKYADIRAALKDLV
jgi:NAD dependent epimerase/dehydratase family enzyme